MKPKLTSHERRCVAAISGCALDTIRHWEADRDSVREASALRIEASLAKVRARTFSVEALHVSDSNPPPASAR